MSWPGAAWPLANLRTVAGCSPSLRRARGDLVPFVGYPGGHLNTLTGDNLGSLGQQPGLADLGRSLDDRDAAGAISRRGDQSATFGAFAVPAARRGAIA